MENIIKINQEKGKWKQNYWTMFFAVLSLIFVNLAIFIPQERLLLLGFTLISIAVAIIFYYIAKTNNNESALNLLNNQLTKISQELIEKFNYLKEISNLRIEIEMLKKKKGEISLIDILKIIVAAILIYVLIEVIKSFT